MAIFCCDDPDERARHARGIGVRVANVIDHAPYHGVQLHPRDCRAAFIEFNHTEGSDDILGPYPPAGPDWQKSIRKDVTQALIGVEMQSPEPQALAEHWGRIIGIAVSQGSIGEPELVLPNCSFRFVKGASEIMSGLTFRVERCRCGPRCREGKGVAGVGRFVSARRRHVPSGGVSVPSPLADRHARACPEASTSLRRSTGRRTWMAGTSPAMTEIIVTKQ